MSHAHALLLDLLLPEGDGTIADHATACGYRGEVAVGWQRLPVHSRRQAGLSSRPQDTLQSLHLGTGSTALALALRKAAVPS